jgi:hypothetical protein
MATADTLDRGRESFGRWAWPDAFDKLSAADRETPLAPEDLELLTAAAYLVGRDMGSVVIDMSMSLDGYIAAPDDNPEQGLGEDGMRLHNWAFDDPSVFERVFGNLIEETGAVIMGRRSYDSSIEAWGHKGPLDDVPCFVVTHTRPRARTRSSRSSPTGSSAPSPRLRRSPPGSGSG